MKIPENYSAFLNWVKEVTEKHWNKSLQNEILAPPNWLHNAKWLGLNESEIDAIEKKHQIKFTLEHRAFLKILHTTDKRKRIKYKDPLNDSKILIKEESIFYNWKLDVDEIEKKFNWQFDYIWDDILGINKSWLPSWGKKPHSDDEKKIIFTNWYKNAPKIIPITQQHYIVNNLSNIQNPILSMRGFDIVVCGWNMKHYLLNQLKEHIGLVKVEYDDESVYQQWSLESTEILNEINKKEFQAAKNKDIKAWKEMILYYDSGYLSFGLPWPSR